MDRSKKMSKSTRPNHHQHSLGKSFCKSQINLPFPYPMLDLKNKTIWPFSKEEFFLIAIGRLIENEKLISIDDLPTILALNKMGFFGAHSSREIIFKSMIDTQNKRQQQSTNKNKPKFTVGFFSLNTVNISSALTNFIGDTNKLKTTNENPTIESTEQKTSFTCMKLNLEEAYFLSYVFGMLKIQKNSSKEFYGLDELWQCFCQLSNDNNDCSTKFVTRFAAYYYFRSQGFVVNNGFKFGVDYLLYEEGPPFNHSHYAIIIEYKYDDDTTDNETKTLNYNEISGLIRISNNSRKELILCTVIIPERYRSKLSITGPGCIKYFKINLIQLRRQTLDSWQNNNGGG
ncbi:tRNA-splicing endonuclease subunit Sen2 [Dermatophagoides pteronyssinus]|uniref:tRNA-intron lyase n=1 Tax=Dermatophagoides pteronyssinus TaxID=6956 RepID=A0ABQ8J3R5_DERPT|nr:tRNA-splicing endonuclease subunit Sen2 [Dermatophagoides pteronyssinus]